jgi:hypothetical protein
MLNWLKSSVKCAFEEGLVGLRFVFDVLTTDNSTGIRQKWIRRRYDVEFASTPGQRGIECTLIAALGVRGSLWFLFGPVPGSENALLFSSL